MPMLTEPYTLKTKHMKLTEIQDLIKFVSKSGVSEVELETKEIKIVIKTPKGGSPVMAAQPAMVMAAPVQTAMAAAPAPLITMRTSSSFFPDNSSALMIPAEQIIAVPCWSSCISGIRISCFSRSSTSKARVEGLMVGAIL